MHHIAALSSGVRGAEGGTATFYVRGTSTAASYYRSPGDTTAQAGSLRLDKWGAATAYVDGLVTVEVRSKSGSVVRSFTSGMSDRAVHAESQSFTGRDYALDSQAAGNPIAVSDVLDLWKDSAGTTDFNVLAFDEEVSLSKVMAGALMTEHWVTRYGATGDGVTDDVGAINEAIRAAFADGGGVVFFPPGSYIVRSEIELLAGVSLVGVGIGSIILSIYDGYAVSVLNPLAEPASIEFLRVAVYSTEGGTCVNIANGGRFFAKNATFINTENGGAVIHADSGSLQTRAVFRDCSIQAVNGSYGIHSELTSAGWIRLVDCSVVPIGWIGNPDGYAGPGLVYGHRVHVSRSVFFESANIDSAYTCIRTLENPHNIIKDNVFLSPNAAGLITPIEVGAVSASSAFFYERGSIWTNESPLFASMPAFVVAANIVLDSIKYRSFSMSDSSTAASDSTPLYLLDPASGDDEAGQVGLIMATITGSQSTYSNCGAVLSTYTASYPELNAPVGTIMKIAIASTTGDWDGYAGLAEVEAVSVIQGITHLASKDYSVQLGIRYAFNGNALWNFHAPSNPYG